MKLRSLDISYPVIELQNDKMWGHRWY